MLNNIANSLLSESLEQTAQKRGLPTSALPHCQDEVVDTAAQVSVATRLDLLERRIQQLEDRLSRRFPSV